MQIDTAFSARCSTLSVMAIMLLQGVFFVALSLVFIDINLPKVCVFLLPARCERGLAVGERKMFKQLILITLAITNQTKKIAGLHTSAPQTIA